jgi:hypothetical protein
MWLYQPLPAAGQQDAAGTTVDVPLGTLVLTGNAPTVTATAHQTVSVPLATLVLTANAPTVTATANQTVSVPVGTLTLAGFAPEVTGGAGLTVNVPLATLTLTGNAPTVTASDHQAVSVPLAELVLTGFAPDVEATSSVPAVVAPAVGGRGKGAFRVEYGPPILEIDDVEYEVETAQEARKVVNAIKRKAMRQIHRAEREHGPLPALPQVVVRGTADWLADMVREMDDGLELAFDRARKALDEEDDIEALLL